MRRSEPVPPLRAFAADPAGVGIRDARRNLRQLRSRFANFSRFPYQRDAYRRVVRAMARMRAGRGLAVLWWRLRLRLR